MGILHPAVLGLDVIYLALVLDVMVVSRYHGGFIGIRPWVSSLKPNVYL